MLEQRSRLDSSRLVSNTMQKAFDEEQLGINDVGGEIVVGNRRGLDILQEFAMLKQSLPRISALEESVEAQNSQIQSLEDRVQGLCASLEGYRKTQGKDHKHV